MVMLLGTSGWTFRDWEGVFYPARDTPKLAYYSKAFRTTEIDTTFYEFPTKAMVQSCSRVTPEGFVFSARVPRMVTHDKRLDVGKGAGDDLMHFLGDLRPLEDAGKLGPLIFQLPQDFTYQDGLGRLIDFFGALPADVKFAVEFRNGSWQRPETWDLLKQCKIASVMADAPVAIAETPVTADFAVIRWHGRGVKTWTDYAYSDAELDEWVPRIREVEKTAKQVYGYFGNHRGAHSVEDSLRLMERLGLTDDGQRAIASSVKRAARARAARHPSEKTDSGRSP